ncbi:MAG: hypothetical protein R3F37_17315 [Candidatus Competibacteraceae bacterium]
MSVSNGLIDGVTYTILYHYDEFSRLYEVTYPVSPAHPLGLVVRYVYNTYGYLSQAVNPLDGTLFWQADAQNAEGRVTANLGNSVTTPARYSPHTGLIKTIQSDSLVAGEIQYLMFGWDALGNLTARHDLNQNLEEQFGYDNLNRLAQSTFYSPGQAPQTKTYGFSAIGNITFKSDVGTYLYGGNGAGPHAVSTVNSQSYTYDANGNNLQSFNHGLGCLGPQPGPVITSRAASSRANRLEFSYGADRARFRQVSSDWPKPYLCRRFVRKGNAERAGDAHSLH